MSPNAPTLRRCSARVRRRSHWLKSFEDRLNFLFCRASPQCSTHLSVIQPSGDSGKYFEVGVSGCGVCWKYEKEYELDWEAVQRSKRDAG